MENLTEYAREQVKACKGFIEANNYEVIKSHKFNI